MSDQAHKHPAELIIAILNWNGYKLTRACAKSLSVLSGPAHKILIVDNGSAEPEAERLAVELGGAVEALTLTRNGGVGAGYNAAIRWAREHGAKYVLLLNNDTIVSDPLFATRLVQACEPGVFAVGPLVKEPGGRVWTAGGLMNWHTYLTGHLQAEEITSPDAPYSVAWVDGSCMLVSVAAACEIQGFDEIFFLYWEEVDICIRASRHGFKCLVEPRTSIVHLVGQTAKPSVVDHLMWRNAILFMRRNGNRRQNFALMWRLLLWQIPLFVARRIKHGGGVRQSIGLAVRSITWNLGDAIRRRSWKREAGGSLACGEANGQ